MKDEFERLFGQDEKVLALGMHMWKMKTRLRHNLRP